MEGRRLTIFVSAFLLSFGSLAQESTESNHKWYRPDFLTVQHAGNIGYFSAGVGYQFFNDFLSTSLLYGYVPKSISEAKVIHTFTIKNTIPLFTRNIDAYSIGAYTGLTFTYETGNNSWLKFPEEFPKGYYFTNAFHLTVFGGIKLHKRMERSTRLKGVDLYVESGTIETYLKYAIESDEVKLHDVFSLAFGINLYFK